MRGTAAAIDRTAPMNPIEIRLKMSLIVTIFDNQCNGQSPLGRRRSDPLPKGLSPSLGQPTLFKGMNECQSGKGVPD